jgi:hypothetical protein
VRDLAIISTGGVLVLLSAWHFYWAAGGVLGKALAVPQRSEAPLFRPSAGATVVVGILLAAAAALVLAQLKTWEAPFLNQLTRWGSWVLAAVFGLRAVGDTRWIGFFKRVRGTPFATLDTWVYSPLCMLLCVGCLCAAGAI